jgi:protein-disulfide isomerase
VLTPSRLAPLVLAALFTALGCHAQSATPTALKTGATVSPALAHRIEILLRGKVQLPPASVISIGPIQPSDVAGYHTVTVSFTADDKTSHPVDFLLSDDGKTVAQFVKYDISADPRTAIADDGRPSRGGPASAPVVMVNFDDLECPFCARLHASLFPAITQRYGDKVHIVYKDFPLTEIHPWAMHAAVDVNCLASQSPTGYWSLVDYIHGHFDDIGSDPTAKPDPTKPDAPKHTLDRAYTQLDKITRDQGIAQKADAAKLDACIAKQDTAAIEVSRKLGDSLNLGSAPTFYINGAKYDGAVPIAFIFDQIDNALRAEGVTPPPPFATPAPPATPTTATPAATPTPTK